MTAQERAFVVLLIVNLIITVIYLIVNLFRKEDNRRGVLVRVVVMLLCPIVGAAVFFVGYICFLLFFHKEVDLADVVFSKERVKSYVHADEERERNLVPVEEAIAVMDTDDLRRLMLSVAHGDVRKSLATIALALDSEDSETSHYAASILQDILNNFRAKVQKDYQEMKADEEDRPDRAHMLIDYMVPVLKQQVFAEMEQKKQVDILDDVCEMLYEADPGSMMIDEYEAAAIRLLEVGAYERSKKWCDRLARQYPDTLSTYTCQLKLYFSMGERETFFRVLNELRRSGVSIDQETLEMIRVFM